MLSATKTKRKVARQAVNNGTVILYIRTKCKVPSGYSLQATSIFNWITLLNAHMDYSYGGILCPSIRLGSETPRPWEMDDVGNLVCLQILHRNRPRLSSCGLSQCQSHRNRPRLSSCGLSQCQSRRLAGGVHRSLRFNLDCASFPTTKV